VVESVGAEDVLGAPLLVLAVELVVLYGAGSYASGNRSRLRHASRSTYRP